MLASEALVLYTSKEGYYFVLLLQVENNPNLSQEVKFKPLHLIFFFQLSHFLLVYFKLSVCIQHWRISSVMGGSSFCCKSLSELLDIWWLELQSFSPKQLGIFW